MHGRPNEIPNAIAFAEDRAERPYDADAVTRFFRACIAVASVLQTFRTGYLGKVSPVHLFWGSFDLAVTRFSGRPAPLHPGGIPALPDEVTREAYSHEVSSAGFWPGGGPVDFPAFYSYAYPAPAGFATAKVLPDAAYFDKNFGEFLLPYDAVRTAPIRKPRSCAFSTAPIAPPPTSQTGMPISNARWDKSGGHGRCRHRPVGHSPSIVDGWTVANGRQKPVIDLVFGPRKPNICAVLQLSLSRVENETCAPEEPDERWPAANGCGSLGTAGNGRRQKS